MSLMHCTHKLVLPCSCLFKGVNASKENSLWNVLWKTVTSQIACVTVQCSSIQDTAFPLCHYCCSDTVVLMQ